MGKLEDRTGKQQNGRGVVHDEQNMPFAQIAAGHIGPFRQLDTGQGIPLGFFDQEFFQTFAAHGQGSDL